jgi:hypothetical protein
MVAAKGRLTRAVGDYSRGFVSEDGKNYRTEYQDLAPAMRRVVQIRHAQELVKKADNPTGRTYIGSVPATLLMSWLHKNGHTLEQFARKEGTIRQDFMKFFLSRDFSKLHVQHSTTRVGTGNRIVVPNYIGGVNGNSKLRRAESSDSGLA